MTEINRHRPIPADLSHPVHHNSGGKTSTPAGGEVPRGQYEQPNSPRNGYIPNDGK